jgi:hypothetical protein
MSELPQTTDQAAAPDTAPDSVPRRVGLKPTPVTRIVLAVAILVLAVCGYGFALALRAEATTGTSVGPVALAFTITSVAIIVVAASALPSVWLKESDLVRRRSRGRASYLERWDLSEVSVGLDGGTLTFVDVGSGDQVAVNVGRRRKKALLALAAMIEAWGQEDLGSVRAAADLRALAASRASS